MKVLREFSGIDRGKKERVTPGKDMQKALK